MTIDKYGVSGWNILLDMRGYEDEVPLDVMMVSTLRYVHYARRWVQKPSRCTRCWRNRLE